MSENQLAAADAAAILESKKQIEAEASKVTNLENAIADMKRQLRAESKASLIRQWIGLYAQVVQLEKENETLKEENKKLKTAESSAAKETK